MKRPNAVPRRWADRLGQLCLWGLVLLPPFVVMVTARDAFRLPKLLLSEWLGLASLACLTERLRRDPPGARIELSWVWRQPALRALLPFLLVATCSWATSSHRPFVGRALVDLWIGAACLAGWALALSAPELRRFLGGLAWPAAATSLLAVFQLYNIYRPFGFEGGIEAWRTGVTSLAGNAGDLACYLVLPCLVLQYTARRAEGRARWTSLVLLALSLFGLLATQTMSAIAALGASSLLLWLLLLPRRRAWAIVGALALLSATAAVGVAPLRQRTLEKLTQLSHGDWNSVLSYRLDGWAAAAWMARKSPWTGVGHGAFRAEFTATKLAMMEEGRAFGTDFSAPSSTLNFVNAHNDYLEVAAELGIPGLLALAWGIGAIVLAAWRLQGEARALAWAGLAAIALLATVQFPFEIALVAYPWLLFFSWVLAAASAPPPPASPTRKGSFNPGRRRAGSPRL